MTEVKSTLELVLEKTKHLKLSRDEKEERQRKEIESILRGLLQKYQDGILSLRNMEKEIARLRNRFGFDEKSILRELVFERFDPDGENDALLEIVRRLLKEDTSGIEGVLKGYQKARAELLQEAFNSSLKTLREKYRISGSAVLPNPVENSDFKASLQKLRESFEAALSIEKKPCK